PLSLHDALPIFKSGNVPDIAIFYDGYNDSLSALFNGTAGVTFDERFRRIEFNALNGLRGGIRDEVYTRALTLFIVHSGLGTLARALFAKFGPNSYQLVRGQLVRVGVLPRPRIASEGTCENDRAIESDVVRS